MRWKRNKKINKIGSRQTLYTQKMKIFFIINIMFSFQSWNIINFDKLFIFFIQRELIIYFGWQFSLLDEIDNDLGLVEKKNKIK